MVGFIKKMFIMLIGFIGFNANVIPLNAILLRCASINNQ